MFGKKQMGYPMQIDEIELNTIVKGKHAGVFLVLGKTKSDGVDYAICKPVNPDNIQETGLGEVWLEPDTLLPFNEQNNIFSITGREALLQDKDAIYTLKTEFIRLLATADFDSRLDGWLIDDLKSYSHDDASAKGVVGFIEDYYDGTLKYLGFNLDLVKKFVSVTSPQISKEITPITTAGLQLVKDNHYGYTGILGEPTIVDDSWLTCQNKPFPDDAVFASLYPISGGGGVVVNLNEITHLGEPSIEQMVQILGREEYSFNPAAETVLELMIESCQKEDLKDLMMLSNLALIFPYNCQNDSGITAVFQKTENGDFIFKDDDGDIWKCGLYEIDKIYRAGEPIKADQFLKMNHDERRGLINVFKKDASLFADEMHNEEIFTPRRKQ